MSPLPPIMSEELSNFQHLHPQESQQTKPKQRPPTAFHPTNPNMNHPPSSRYGSPLTINVVVMFLFYVLSVSLCLSSFSTCICVIFNPVGTFRTVANYLFYALGFSVLLTFLFVALTVYFDTQASLEEQRIREIVDETPSIEVHREAANSQDAIDFMPRQGTRHEVSSSQEIIDATPIQEGNYILRPPPIEAQTATLRNLTDIDTLTTNPATRDNPAPPCTSQQVALENDPETPCIDSADTINRIPRFSKNVSTSTTNAAYHEETASQEKVTARFITARASKKIEKWISQTNFTNTHAATAKAFRGVRNKGDDANDEDEDLDGEIMACSGPLCETHSADRDSDFQKALRVYMGTGGKCGGRKRRWGCSTPSLASSGESEFQGGIRKTFMLEKVGERRRARSA